MSNDWKMEAAREIEAFYAGIDQQEMQGIHRTATMRIKEAASILARHAPPVEELLEAARLAERELPGIRTRMKVSYDDVKGDASKAEIRDAINVTMNIYERLRSALSHWEEKK